MKKYYIKVFGCQMNLADAERIATFLEKLGYEKTSEMENADYILVFSCSVRQTAVDRLTGFKPKFKNLKAKKILTGCVLKADYPKMQKFFDYILDLKDEKAWNKVFKGYSDYIEFEPKRESSYQAYVPISNGCENFCTYCAVPYTRGKLVCRDYKNIIKEVEKAVKNGVKEVWLLGQNVNDYDFKGKDFSDLLLMVDDIKGDFWLRFTSPHPKNFSSKLVKTLGKLSKFKPYMNLPLQSGSDTVLKRMNRPYKYEDYKKLANSLKKELGEDLNISTDIIVGFSGETKKEFSETKKAFKEIDFDMAYISQYSTRPQTYSLLKMEDDVLKAEKKERDKILTDILKKQSFKKNKKYLGRIFRVLVSGKKGDYYLSKSENYKTVKFKSDKKDLIGTFINIKINKALEWGLEGEEFNKVVVLLGTTASGKTEIAKKLIKDFNGEIISADSRQIYRKMDIGTAKDKTIKQNLVDNCDLNEDYNVALYKKDAIQKINEILSKGKIPFVVGGTGLYIQALVDNIDFPQIEPDLKLRKELEEKTKEELFEIYKKIDKEGSLIIDKDNKRRLVRAIEVTKKTGKSFFENTKNPPLFNFVQIGIKVEKDELEKRINKRVDKMILEGLEDEVRELKKYPKNPILQTIGYREWEEYEGDEIIKRIKINTFKFAKRQLTWFKRDQRISWVKSYGEIKKILKKVLTN